MQVAFHVRGEDSLHTLQRCILSLLFSLIEQILTRDLKRTRVHECSSHPTIDCSVYRCSCGTR